MKPHETATQPIAPKAQHQRRLLPWLQGLVFGSLSCLIALSSLAGETSVVDTLPPEPVLLPKIHGMELENGAYEYTDPYLPLMTATRDYRVGVSRKLQVINGVSEVRFFLLKPEALDDQVGLAGSPPGAAHWIDIFDMYAGNLGANPQLVADADDFHSHGDADFGPMHFSICDPTLGHSNGRNPYSCGPNLDCYEFDLMLGLSIGHTAANPNPSGADEAQLFSTRVLVKILNPKTAAASIQSVEIVDKNGNGNRSDETVAGPRFEGTTSHGIGSFHTPMIVGDQNELLFVRIGGNSVPQYTDENGQPRTSGKHDMVYSVNTTGNPCDVNAWTELRPISFAPIDPEVADFGFAQNPFRTPSGHEIQPHERIYGTYLWVDQDADNLFFGSLKRPLLSSDIDPAKPLYDYTCWNGGDECHSGERRSNFHGWMMAGLWTHGKMVLLDSLVNNMDFGILAAEKYHTRVQLFSDRAIRIGTGEDASKIDGGSEPAGYARTTVQFGSTEHFLNMVDAMKPRTPRDVVWHVTAGAVSDEIAFDDLISHRTLIFSPMNALKEMDPGADLTYYDGNQSADPGQSRTLRLQNSATSKRFLTPPFGEVVASSDQGRIENVALGGIKARGFYLFSPSSIRYSIPSQDLSGRDWLISLFLDRRDSSTGRSRLLTLPSGASVSLDGGNAELRLCGSSGSCTQITLPIGIPTKAWNHLAFLRVGSTNKVQLFQNGFLFAEIDQPVGFDISSGDLEVGNTSSSSEAGFEGWIDEFKVIEGPFNLEEVCNHARGTLVSMPSSYQGDPTNPFAQLELPFHARDPKPAHWVSGREAVQDALHNATAIAQSLSDYFACHVDYTSHLGVSVHHPGDLQIRSLRRRILFPEGPVVFNHPRPTSIQNNFCLSCHEPGRTAGLHTDALIADLAQAQNDARRMPMQAPRDLTGWVPSGYFGPDRPATDTSYSDLNPLVSDRWTHNGPIFRWKFDSGAGALQHNWVGGNLESGHDGDATSTLGLARKPGVGRAHSLEFDGSGGYLRVDSLFGDEPDIVGNQLTLATWMRLDYPGQSVTAQDQCLPFSSSVPCTVIAKSGAGNHDITWGLRVLYKDSSWWAQMHVTNSNGDIANRSQALGSAFDPSAFDPGAWHHLAAIYDDGAVEFFLDGSSLGAGVSIHSSDTDLLTDPSHPISIGAKLKSGTTALFPFHGRLDELHVYDRALADWEVALLVVETP